MILEIDLSRMKHLKDKSCYNRNYYSYGNTNVELLQICLEDYNQCDYFLINSDGHQVFLGSSDSNCDDESIEFMYRYT